jgi:hypothetical protein
MQPAHRRVVGRIPGNRGAEPENPGFRPASVCA